MTSHYPINVGSNQIQPVSKIKLLRSHSAEKTWSGVTFASDSAETLFCWTLMVFYKTYMTSDGRQHQNSKATSQKVDAEVQTEGRTDSGVPLRGNYSDSIVVVLTCTQGSVTWKFWQVVTHSDSSFIRGAKRNKVQHGQEAADWLYRHTWIILNDRKTGNDAVGGVKHELLLRREKKQKIQILRFLFLDNVTGRNEVQSSGVWFTESERAVRVRQERFPETSSTTSSVNQSLLPSQYQDFGLYIEQDRN